ncbi:MAG: AAA family ATPase [Gammaproteobacteria bacterium]|nr:AAA family ATPase [Gammaproteobacteria bacterium]NIR84826.1 AAA family ATPase [Gammaproteobacteria bacterium]NIR91540.1 AAA family ATPase [Gammaproteobacteria bacterium]NIV76728.1 AAA family ATPase [Gammaproteobacteria bacterium]
MDALNCGPIMRCPHCQTENREGRRFCARCGATLAQPCPGCGFANEPGEDFCGGCGKRLGAAQPARTGPETADAERRQVTVMFCDLVGSTELSGRLDPEDLRELLQRYQASCAEVVARFGGHIARYVGDGLLVYFGYPDAHEDDPVRAVQAGLAIVAAMETLNRELGRADVTLAVRVGINTGRVVAGDIGSGERRDAMAIVGETPNIAARLQALAEPGAVVIGHTTRRLVEGLFVCDALDEQRLRGVPVPVQAHRVRAESELRSRFEAAAARGLTPLVGREQEVALLLERWEQTKDGDGQVILLSGEAGIGKSRVVRAFQERVRDELETRILYHCSPYHQNSALYPAIDQLERGLRFETNESTARKLEKLDRTLAELRLPVAEHGPVLAALLSLPSEGRYPPLALSPDEAKQRTLEAVVAVFEAMAARAPVLMVVEDAHWADASTVELLDLIVERAASVRLCLIITFRLEFDAPWRSGVGHVTAISLNRLGRRQTAALVSSVARDQGLAPELVRRIVAKTDGVPLFAEELTKVLMESGALAPHARALENAAPELAIPASLQDSLMARLDRLGPAKEIAQLAATIGRGFGYELLKAVAPASAEELHAALSRLMESELVYRRTLTPETTYEFKHALVRDAAYASLLRSRRQQYHRQIAEALEERFAHVAETEPALLAHHYTEADLAERAVGYWLTAGGLLHERGATDMSIDAYRRALDMAQDETIRCRALTGLAAAMRVVDRYDEALQALAAAEQIADARGLLAERSAIHHLRGNLYFPLGKIDACHEQHERALGFAQRAHSPEAEARALGGLGDAEYARGRVITAHDYFVRCIEVCRQHGFERIEAANAVMIAGTEHYFEALRKALNDAQAALRIAQRVGQHRAQIVAHTVIYHALFDMANTRGAAEHVEQAQALIRQTGHWRFEPENLNYLAKLRLLEGDRAGATALLEQAYELAEKSGIAYTGGRLLGTLALATDDAQQRRWAFAEGERLLHAGAVSHNHLWFYREAIECCLQDGDGEGAKRYADALEAYTRAQPLPWADFFIARGRALAVRGRGGRDEASRGELERLRQEARRLDLYIGLPALEEALSRTP